MKLTTLQNRIVFFALGVITGIVTLAIVVEIFYNVTLI